MCILNIELYSISKLGCALETLINLLFVSRSGENTLNQLPRFLFCFEPQKLFLYFKTKLFSPFSLLENEKPSAGARERQMGKEFTKFTENKKKCFLNKIIKKQINEGKTRMSD